MITDWRRAQVLPILAGLLILTIAPLCAALLESREVRGAAIDAVEQESGASAKVLWTLRGRSESGRRSKYIRLVCTESAGRAQLVVVLRTGIAWRSSWEAIEVAPPGGWLAPPNDDVRCRTAA